MQCPKCGNTNIMPGQKFCTKCGQPLTDSNPQPSAPQPMAPRPMAAPQPMKGMPQPMAPRPMGAPQPMKGMPQQPIAPQPIAPRPVPKQPVKGPQPVQPQQAGGDKGLLNVLTHPGAAIRGAIHGADAQVNRENELDVLIPMAQFKVRDAGKRVAQLIKKYKEKFTAEDELNINELIDKLKKAIAEGGNPSSIKKAIDALDKGLFDVETKLGEPHANGNNDSDGQQSEQPKKLPVQTIELHDINEDELAIVKNKAIWGIQRGQIARRITERELDTAENLKGFIIQQGCSAMIFVNGALIDTFDAGAYELPSKNEQKLKEEYDKLFTELQKQHEEEEKKAVQREKDRMQNASIAERGGLFGIAKDKAKRFFEFFVGAKKQAQENKNREEEILKKLKAETEKMLKKNNPDPLLSIILVSNRAITLTFGGMANNEGSIDYAPYTIPTKLFDLEVGVSLQMQISDIATFATNYLADHNSFNTIDLFNQVNSSIENQLRQSLRNLDYQAEGLSPEVQNNLKAQIVTMINNQVFGIVCTQVMQITDSSADFERFRSVERELYCAEKELDFLQRTGEMKNRLEIETNSQTIRAAQNAEDLRYALQQINKDQLLHDDELEEFVLLLESQKRIREAKTQEEEYEALQDLRKSRLVKDDEMAELEDALSHNTIKREEVTEIMRIQSHRNVENERLLALWALDDMKTDHDWEREDLERRRNYGIEDEERERKWNVEDQEITRRLNHLKEQDIYDDERDEYKYNRDFSRRQQLEDYLFQQQQRQRQADFENRVQNEDYDWQKAQRERAMAREDEQIQFDRERQNKFDDSDILNRDADAATDRLLKIKEAERAEAAMQQQHEQNIHAMDTDVEKSRIAAQATMSADQLAAQQMANLDAAAQAELAKAMGSGDKVKAEMLSQQNDQMKELYNQMLQMQQQNQQGQQQSASQTQEQMMQMMQMMMGGMTQMSANQAAAMGAQFQQQQQFQQQRLEDQMQMKNEYRDNMMHQQDRMDANIKQAMDFTTRSHQTDSQSFAQAMGGVPNNVRINQQPQQPQQPQQEAPQQEEQMYACPHCGQPVSAWRTPCPHCNNEIQWQ